MGSIPASTPNNTALVDQANVATTSQLSSSSTTSASLTTTTTGGGTNVYVWTGAAGDSQWANAGNWNTDSVPGSSNDVVIPQGTPLAIAGGPVTIHNLELDGALEADGAFGATNVTLAGGTLTGGGVFSASASLAWTGGQMSGTGTTRIGSGAVLAISGSARRPLTAGRWTTRGTATWSGDQITAGGAAAITNEASATFTLNGSPSFVDSAGTSTFNNNGTFTKSSDGGESDIGASFLNGGTGTVAVDGGLLGFGNGGSSSGTFQIAGGAGVAVKGGAFGLGGLVLGTGQLVIGSGFSSLPATVTVNAGTMNVQNVVLVTGGTLTGSGELDVGTSLQWTDGTINGGIKVVIVQGRTYQSQASTRKPWTTRRSINNGTATWDGGLFAIEGGGEFHNAGTFTASGNLALAPLKQSRLSTTMPASSSRRTAPWWCRRAVQVPPPEVLSRSRPEERSTFNVVSAGPWLDPSRLPPVPRSRLA